MLLKISGLRVGYDKTPLLGPVDLELGKGQIKALIGPNGSGKSTLLKTICGLLAPISGKLELADRPIQSLGPREIAQQVASVPQDESYAFGFTVSQVVGMGRLAHSQGFFESAEDLSKSLDAMRASDCDKLSDRVIGTLSGGERQRALIARALAQETPLVLFDEPTAHLDVRHVLEFGQLARTLAEKEKGLIIATHDLNSALTLSDEVLLVHEGRVKFSGPPQELVRQRVVDEVYQVPFQRLEQDGRTLLIPTYR